MVVQEPRLCVEILQQLAAAEAALNRISLAVFRFHVEKCVPDGITKASEIPLRYFLRANAFVSGAKNPRPSK